jgi:glycosyltransferase involved in cell wall biosynthesis
MIFTLADFEESYIHKSLHNIPKYMQKKFHSVNLEIFYLNKSQEIGNDNKIKYTKIKEHLFPFFKTNLFNRNFFMIIQLILHAKKIEILMLLHMTNITALFAIIYKFINSKGKVYIKLDMDQKFFDYKPSKTAKYILTKYINLSSVISIESFTMYKIINNHGLLGIDISHKLVRIPNAFDEELFLESNIPLLEYQKKDNLIITVGRLGTNQKNTKMLLDVIKQLEFNDWKFYLIGSIENNFRNKIDDLFLNKPQLKDKVFFTGEITDKNILYDFYNRAKIFALTSDYEGFATVFVEAIYFGNYVVTTNVNGAIEATNDNVIGDIINTNDVESFYKTLQKRMIDKKYLETTYPKIINHSHKNYIWSKVIQNEKLVKLLGLDND